MNFLNEQTAQNPDAYYPKKKKGKKFLKALDSKNVVHWSDVISSLLMIFGLVLVWLIVLEYFGVLPLSALDYFYRLVPGQ